MTRTQKIVLMGSAICAALLFVLFINVQLVKMLVPNRPVEPKPVSGPVYEDPSPRITAIASKAQVVKVCKTGEVIGYNEAEDTYIIASYAKNNKYAAIVRNEVGTTVCD